MLINDQVTTFTDVHDQAAVRSPNCHDLVEIRDDFAQLGAFMVDENYVFAATQCEELRNFPLPDNVLQTIQQLQFGPFNSSATDDVLPQLTSSSLTPEH